jgi:endoglucanase
LSDPVLTAKFSASTPPALCYADDQGSYASNEIAINWNAPMVFVTGYFAYAPVSTGMPEEDQSKPGTVRLGQNYPNPFNGPTVIPFELEKQNRVGVKIFDIRGRVVDSHDLGLLSSGSHTFQWKASTSQGIQLSSGTYFVELRGGNLSSVIKIVFAK